VVVVSTRDCSLQRRNQKLLEEAPAPFLPEGVHDRLVEASRRLLETVDYVGVATCEFLLTPEGDIWFLEVNPRLQVEHCVTEEVAGTDLVEIQLRIAEGGHLGQINEPRGHSLELRITCEDPARGLAPSTGTITRLRWPAGPGIRIESGVTEGDVVTPLFDPMLAKIIITGASREQAIARALDRITALADGRMSIRDLILAVEGRIDTDGLDWLSPFNGHPGHLARPRHYELHAALNRLRGLCLTGT